MNIQIIINGVPVDTSSPGSTGAAPQTAGPWQPPPVLPCIIAVTVTDNANPAVPLPNVLVDLYRYASTIGSTKSYLVTGQTDANGVWRIGVTQGVYSVEHSLQQPAGGGAANKTAPGPYAVTTNGTSSTFPVSLKYT